jgi:hypothetical protein
MTPTSSRFDSSSNCAEYFWLRAGASNCAHRTPDTSTPPVHMSQQCVTARSLPEPDPRSVPAGLFHGHGPRARQG